MLYEQVLWRKFNRILFLFLLFLLVLAYLGEVTILKKACPLKYWNSNQTHLPALARVARKYLTAPCTNVDSERLFSAVSNVIDEKKNRIHCDNAEMLIFIQKNPPH